MRFPFAYLNVVLFISGLILLLFGVFADPVDILKAVGFPANKLGGERGQTDLAILHRLTLAIAFLLLALQIILWKNPNAVSKLAAATKAFTSAAAGFPFFTALFLGFIILAKTVLQLCLFLVGYRAYTGDDFARALKADEWLREAASFDVWTWLSPGMSWLPFPDYLFGVALAVHRDIYVTTRVVNLLLSSIVVIVAYLLARELFGRLAGIFTAILCAFQPWVIWLGFSGMTSDLPSVIMITLFGLFLFRWFAENHAISLLAAAGCLFVASGIRYENWFFSVIFSLALVYRFLSAIWGEHPTRERPILFLTAIAIANAFPVLHMVVSYSLLGDLIPAMRTTDSFRETGAPVPKINMTLLALSAFPLEIASALGGIGLFLKSQRRNSARLCFLAIVVLTFVLFATVFKGRLPVHGAGPQRILLPYLILLSPFAGFLISRFIRSSGRRPLYVVFAAMLVVTLASFDISRAFNYPTSKEMREIVAAGWTLRMLQNIGAVRSDEKILIEKPGLWKPSAVSVIANKPERFVILDTSVAGHACSGGFQTQECRKLVLDGKFDIIILSSPEKVRSFQEIVTGSSWQIGSYHIFKLNRDSQHSQM